MDGESQTRYIVKIDLTSGEKKTMNRMYVKLMHSLNEFFYLWGLYSLKGL